MPRLLSALLLLCVLILAGCTSPESPPVTLHPDTEQGLTLLFGQRASGASAPRDTAQGRLLLEKAYQAGDAVAARWLGVLAARRGDGEAAQRFYQTAAARGDGEAFEWEQLLHEKGVAPFPVNLAASVQVAAREAQRGNAKAQASLDRLIADIDAAAQRGTPEAIALRAALENASAQRR